jgi:sulfur carrier protein
MIIVLNGEQAEVSSEESLARVLERMGVSSERRGVAVAVDGEVVPRAQWKQFTLPEHAHVEVLSAMQGG